MHKRIIIGALLVVASFVIIGLFINNRTPILSTSPITEEEYAIYQKIINSEYLVGSKRTSIVINENTRISIDGKFNPAYIKKEITAIQQETIDDFQNVNQQNYLLKNGFKSESIDYVLISQKNIDNFFKKAGGWDSFYKKYPNSQGIMELSRVGFNSQKDQALVYIGNESNFAAGEGKIYFLTKKYDIWKIEKVVDTWVS